MKPAIRGANDTDDESRTKTELEALLDAFNLAPWCFTTDVLVDEATRIPHSHPVLTLSTRRHGRMLLAGYVHEQLHWFCDEHGEVVDALISDELEQRYPSVPVGDPDGCRSTFSTYLHLIVCWQEIDALRSLIGQADADQFGRRMADSGHYRWVYATIVNNFDALADLYEPRGLRICP